MAAPKSPNMVRRDTLAARAKVLVAEINERQAMLDKVTGGIAACDAAIAAEAAAVKAAPVPVPNVVARALGGAKPQG